jgi:hypothetical protein
MFVGCGNPVMQGIATLFSVSMQQARALCFLEVLTGVRTELHDLVVHLLSSVLSLNGEPWYSAACVSPCAGLCAPGMRRQALVSMCLKATPTGFHV